MPSRFETVGDATSGALEPRDLRSAARRHEKRLARIDAVTAADVKRVAEEYLKPESMTVVVVGDKGSVGPQLDALELGPRDEHGNPLAPPAAKKPTAKN